MSRAVDSGWMCSRNTNWSKRIKSSSGATYIVSFGRVANPDERGCMHDYSCTCPDFQFRKSSEPRKYCKHILRAKRDRCTWHTQFNGPSMPVVEEGRSVCPICRSDAIPIRFLT